MLLLECLIRILRRWTELYILYTSYILYSYLQSTYHMFDMFASRINPRCGEIILIGIIFFTVRLFSPIYFFPTSHSLEVLTIIKMGQIEELPDDYDESKPSPQLRTAGSSSSTTQEEKTGSRPLVSDQEAPFPIIPEKIKNDDPLAPELPPAMASIRSYTPDQLADMMNKTPLFMTDIDKAGDERTLSIFLFNNAVHTQAWILIASGY